MNCSRSSAAVWQQSKAGPGIECAGEGSGRGELPAAGTNSARLTASRLHWQHEQQAQACLCAPLPPSHPPSHPAARAAQSGQSPLHVGPVGGRIHGQDSGAGCTKSISAHCCLPCGASLLCGGAAFIQHYAANQEIQPMLACLASHLHDCRHPAAQAVDEAQYPLSSGHLQGAGAGRQMWARGGANRNLFCSRSARTLPSSSRNWVCTRSAICMQRCMQVLLLPLGRRGGRLRRPPSAAGPEAAPPQCAPGGHMWPVAAWAVSASG